MANQVLEFDLDIRVDLLTLHQTLKLYTCGIISAYNKSWLNEIQDEKAEPHQEKGQGVEFTCLFGKDVSLD